jgi:XRE family transcriptional regulator, regulator of sulfur utilization
MLDRDTEYDFSILRGLRRQRRMRLEQLAKATGISYATLVRIESNQNLPNLRTLGILAEYFGMTPAHLLESATATIVDTATEVRAMGPPANRREISFADMRVRVGRGRKGESDAEPHQHPGFYQTTWVLTGRIQVQILNRQHEIAKGEAIRFDASHEHAVQYLEDSELLVVLTPKAPH